jgi:hypothetical protein
VPVPSPTCAARKVSQQSRKPDRLNITQPPNPPLQPSTHQNLIPVRNYCNPNTSSRQTTPQSHMCATKTSRVSSDSSALSKHAHFKLRPTMQRTTCSQHHHTNFITHGLHSQPTHPQPLHKTPQHAPDKSTATGSLQNTKASSYPSCCHHHHS